MRMLTRLLICAVGIGSLVFAVPTHLSRRLVEDSQNPANDSNPRSCLVAGIDYAHGQQVEREDPCVYCLCLDGDMFCWWSEMQCHNSSVYNSQSADSSGSVTGGGGGSNSNYSSGSGSSDDWWSTWQPHTEPPPPPQPLTTHQPPAATNTTATATDTPSPSVASSPTSTSLTICIVMGREYSMGEVLPQETGTCLECECGRGGRVTCSPKDCVPAEGEGDPAAGGDSDNDEFHNPNDANSLDMFDVDIF